MNNKIWQEDYSRFVHEREIVRMLVSKNMNSRPIETDGIPVDPKDNSIETESVSVYFRDLEERLIDCIGKYDAVVGCVAWLTNERILDALSKVECAIVVQKENWNNRLRLMYDNLNFSLDRYWVGGVISNMSVACDPTIQGVRCVGNYNYEKKPAFPRMHNKFLVFCETYEGADNEEDGDFHPPGIIPKCVWTGSFNLTQNAVLSLENAVILRQPEIANAYFNEWLQIEAISEPLDWESHWCAPEWRIGT